MKNIDTTACPVYMLTGEYDWSNTPAMSQATCDKIRGAKHQAMKGLGHFPMTENPRVFVDYCESGHLYYLLFSIFTAFAGELGSGEVVYSGRQIGKSDC